MKTAKPEITVGYNALIARYSLQCVPDRTSSLISGRARLVERIVQPDDTVTVRYPRPYGFADTLAGHLEFSLKYEGVNLQVMAAVFEAVGSAELQAWLDAKPASKYARICGHLYEWLTGKSLDYKRRPGVPKVSVLDERQYFVAQGRSDARFSVVNNLPGTPAFCPLVRRTPALERWLDRKLESRIAQMAHEVEPGLLTRAADYLYLAETRSSFALERDVADHARAERFRQLLEHAGEDVPLSEETYVTWQNVVVPKLRAEASYRQVQNWLARPGRMRNLAQYVPPKPTDVATMMDGIATVSALVKGSGFPVVLAAACASFGFVFVHPFLDGNGRVHRFLLHHLLRLGKFTPAGLVVPVSVAMQNQADKYAGVLRSYSSPRTAKLDYVLDSEHGLIDVPTPQPRYLYAFFDATAACEFVFDCLAHAIDQDLLVELQYLRSYDTAMNELRDLLDAPQPELDRLVRSIAQNHGTLSHNKRGQFPLIDDAIVARVERIVQDAFKDYLAMQSVAEAERKAKPAPV